MSTYNQMLYVNLCSGLISLTTLLWSGELLPSIQFSLTHFDFMVNSLILSFAASFGQMIILITIKEFGALFFATVMTVRQVVSIILSCLIYLHPLTVWQWLSSAVVFGILYWKDATKAPRHHHHHRASSAPSSSSSSSSSPLLWSCSASFRLSQFSLSHKVIHSLTFEIKPAPKRSFIPQSVTPCRHAFLRQMHRSVHTPGVYECPHYTPQASWHASPPISSTSRSGAAGS